MSTPTTSPNSSTTDRVRLHISPFNSSLLLKILPPSLQSQATNISFHTVQTFPDRGFGYVELPTMEAQKLKKKLNGATLKGTKIRVEEAKPEKKRKSEDATAESDEGRKVRRMERQAKKKKGAGEEQGVIAGYEIEEGRRVKRGWKDEEAVGKKGKARKKVGDGEQGKKLRFKTSVPISPAEADSKSDSKTKKSKESTKPKKKVVVEEFTKRRKPATSSTNRGAVDRGSLSFEDGVGWVDDVGNVIEAAPISFQRDAVDIGHDSERRISAIESTEPPNESDQHIDNDAMSVDEPEPEPGDTTPRAELNAQDPPQQPTAAKEIHPLEALFKRPATARTTSPPATVQPSSRNSSKTRKAPPKAINTSFSFFPTTDNDDDDAYGKHTIGAGGAGDMAPPQTPHTKRDLEWRSIRSAAPTPDTAAIGRRFSFGLGGAGGGRSSDEDEDLADGDDEVGNGHGEREMGQDTPMRGIEEEAEDVEVAGLTARGVADGEADGSKSEESAFRKWFYENRGDLNRSWKRRRRDEKKVLRQRENRRVGARVA